MAKSKLTMVTAVTVVILTAVAFVNAKTTVEGKGSTIEQMVNSDKVPEAAQKLKSDYRFDNPDGLHAVRQFSLLVLRRGLKETDPYERCYAASALGANGDEGSVKILEAAFSSPDPGLKMAAVDGLGDMGNGIAAASFQRLYHTADAYGKRLLVSGLGQVNHPQAITLLVVAAGESDGDTRMLAVEALGRLHDTDALPQLHKLMAIEEQPYNKIMVAHSMLLLGDNSGIATLLRVARESNNSDYRAAAIMALADARDASVAGELKKGLADPDPEVRIAAAGALTHYNDDEGLAVLRTAMEADDSHTRSEVGQLLEHLDYSVAKATVLASLSSPDPGLRLAGTHALGLFGGEQAVDPLTDSLHTTSDPIMRADIAWALGRIAGPRCIDPLMGMVIETDPAVRYTAADALARTSNRLLDHTADSANKSHP